MLAPLSFCSVYETGKDFVGQVLTNYTLYTFVAIVVEFLSHDTLAGCLRTTHCTRSWPFPRVRQTCRKAPRSAPAPTSPGVGPVSVHVVAFYGADSWKCRCRRMNIREPALPTGADRCSGSGAFDGWR